MRQRIRIHGKQGFTLIEIAIALVIIGLLAGSGMSLMGVLTKRKLRTETTDYMDRVAEALINYADVYGRLPWADPLGGDPDGRGNPGVTSGYLPYIDLSLRPADTYRRVLRYHVNAGLTSNRATNCAVLRAGPLSGPPLVVDHDDSSGTPMPMAFVLVSGGPMDADNDGQPYDALSAGVHTGDNSDGDPNYIRYPPTDTFDDLTRYIGANDLVDEVCRTIP